MSRFTVTMLGELTVCTDERRPLRLPKSAKARELFCYLLLHRHRPHSRESLAGQLWGDGSTTQSMKYLRQALWQLQEAVDEKSDIHSTRLFEADPRLIRVNPAADLWLDVALLEEAVGGAERTHVGHLGVENPQRLKDAVELYRGALLEGWYQDWCLYERERLEDIYLVALDRLVNYCEANREYAAGLAYGNRVLRIDRAHELTHLGMMRLYYLAGDRTSALRQYERCVDALRDDLGVKPAQETHALFLRIKEDYLSTTARATGGVVSVSEETTMSKELDGRLEALEGKLSELQRLQAEIQNDIRAIRLLPNASK